MTGRARSISNGLTIAGFAERYADPLRGRIAQCAVRRDRTTAIARKADAVAAMIAGHEISAVIFDCDGVLVDSEVLAIKGERRALGAALLRLPGSRERELAEAVIRGSERVSRLLMSGDL